MRSPNLTPFLRNKLGKESRGRKCGNSPKGERARPCLVILSLGDGAPYPGPAKLCAWEEEPQQATPGEVTTQLQTPLVIVCSPPSRNGSACNQRRLLCLATEDCSIGPLEGDAAWERASSPRQQAGVRELDWGRGTPPPNFSP